MTVEQHRKVGRGELLPTKLEQHREPQAHTTVRTQRVDSKRSSNIAYTQYRHVQEKFYMTWRRVDPTNVEQHRKTGRGELIPERVSNTASCTSRGAPMKWIDKHSYKTLWKKRQLWKTLGRADG